MKPKVLHCVDDPNMGGVNFALQSLCGSPLKNDVDFTIQYIDFSQAVKLNEVPDIVCLHGASNWRNLFNVLRFKLTYPKVKLVLQEHHYSAAFVDEQIKSPRRFYLMLKLSYGLMDRVIAISPSQQKWMLKHKLTTANKIALLGQGRDLTGFTANNSSLQEKSENTVPIIAAYGRFHHQKGFDLLINALKLVKLPCRLRLAGEGAQASKLKELAAEHSNVGSANIEVVDKVDDVSSFLQACDAVIIPSRWEPFGLIFIESLAMNKPIISSQVDGLGDQINQHSANHLIEGGHQSAITPIAEPISVENIADTIDQFLSQAASLNPDANIGYINHWKQQQWLELQQAWKSLFKQLLGDK
ncbi:glycosyltransferase family 4 protein [uncultured Shewanella sp.]|uniref:glycosyltransferase family 4 protein n=1 Tax=uncultured Shewanella sp. TaxID=173975 RepID=UPI00263037E3|nr:glycosyltransferase family 4 protein [uncultured Shewanella sp.]